jgi:hypothetical protein
MINVKEIIDAWTISYKPTENQLNKSIERGKICETCPSRKIIKKKFKLSTNYGECGCPISKKIFSPDYNPCPLKKWEVVENSELFIQKNSKTII